MYIKCPDCGASLDPGERCDCKEEAAPGSEPTGSGTMEPSNAPSITNCTLAAAAEKLGSVVSAYLYESGYVSIEIASQSGERCVLTYRKEESGDENGDS